MSRLVALVACCLVGACSEPAAPLAVNDVVVKRPLPGMSMSAGYLTLSNNSSAPITISRVTSPQFDAVEMHETIVEDGVSRMVAIGNLTIPPASQVVFEPGGKHLMLMRPAGELDVVTLVIHSEDAVVLTVDVTPVD